MEEKRKVYTREFKIEAVRLLDSSGKSGHEIEDDLGISRGQIYRWRRLLAEENGNIRAFPGTGNARDEELVRLKRELAIVREEREILRKAVAIFSRPKR
jgi:transposase-like protein